jgi:hypothetical protein
MRSFEAIFDLGCWIMHGHLYEKILLFLTGVGIGIYVYGLRRFYNRIYPSSVGRPAQQAKATKANKHTATRAV